MSSENADPQTSSPAIPDALPVLPLRGTVIFPMAVVPLAVGRPESVKLVDDVMRGGRFVALVAQRTDTAGAATPTSLLSGGNGGIIHQLARVPDGTLRLMVQGIERIRLRGLSSRRSPTSWCGLRQHRIHARPPWRAQRRRRCAARQWICFGGWSAWPAICRTRSP